MQLALSALSFVSFLMEYGEERKIPKLIPKSLTQGSKEVSKHFLSCRKAKPYDDSGHFEYPIAMLSSMCS